MPNPLFVVKLGNWAILNDCMLGGMLNEGLIMFSWQHDIQSPKNTVACKYETFFFVEKKRWSWDVSWLEKEERRRFFEMVLD